MRWRDTFGLDNYIAEPTATEHARHRTKALARKERVSDAWWPRRRGWTRRDFLINGSRDALGRKKQFSLTGDRTYFAIERQVSVSGVAPRRFFDAFVSARVAQQSQKESGAKFSTEISGGTVRPAAVSIAEIQPEGSPVKTGGNTPEITLRREDQERPSLHGVSSTRQAALQVSWRHVDRAENGRGQEANCRRSSA